MTTYRHIRQRVASIEASWLRSVLERAEWSLTAAARDLECGVSTLQTAIARHDDLADEYRRRRSGG